MTTINTPLSNKRKLSYSRAMFNHINDIYRLPYLMCGRSQMEHVLVHFHFFDLHTSLLAAL